jgi:hypothetical protein
MRPARPGSCRPGLPSAVAEARSRKVRAAARATLRSRGFLASAARERGEKETSEHWNSGI